MKQKSVEQKKRRNPGDTASKLSPWIRGAAVGAGAFLLAMTLWLFGVFNGLERLSYDARAVLFREAMHNKTEAVLPGDERVVLVLLDDASLSWAEESNGITWPWPRELYSYMLNFFSRVNVKSVALDVLYVEPSNFGVYDDELFAQSIAQVGRVAAAMRVSTQEGIDAWPEEGMKEKGASISGLTVLTEEFPEIFRNLNYPLAEFPIPEVSAAAGRLGNVHLRGADDGVYRRVPLFSLFDNEAVPSLGLAAYLSGNPGKELSINGKEVLINGSSAVMDRQGRVIPLYSTLGDTHPAYSAAAVIQSEIQLLSGEEPNIDPREFENAYILFGFSAAGLFDLRPTPLAAMTPGVEVHATILENILSGGFVGYWEPWATLLLAFFFSVFLGALGARAGRAEFSVGLYLLAVVFPLGAAAVGYLNGIWLEVVFLLAAGLLTMAGSSVVNFATEGKQKRFIKGAFSQYLSPDVIEQLVANPGLLKLGGDRRELTIYFSDLQGFTSISEHLSPEELTALLNDYLSAMTEIIQSEGGTIDKYEGDAIIAFWNAPVTLEDHPRRGVRAALTCQKRLAELRPEFKERTGKELFMRIGMNTGPAVVGNMGSHSRFDYTMLGDAVNLAARLEGVNKQFGTYTMISGNTYEQVRNDFAFRELGRVAVVGRAEPVTVYEPMEREANEKGKDTYRLFGQALSLYYEGEFTRAAEVFAEIKDIDPPAEKYLPRCVELAENPPENWRGVWVMTSK